MNKFELKNKVTKRTIQTKFGLITINDIKFDSEEIQNILPDIVFEDNNLKFMFQKKIEGREKQLVLKRFLPNSHVTDLIQFIEDSISRNKTFYSFLAEGMLGLVFRDVYGFDLSVGIIDITETLNDTHSGSDVCMFDKEKNVLVIGEAKFYEKFNNGMNAIISDFTQKSILNKLDSFKRKVENNDYSWEILLRNLKLETYETIQLDKFVQQKMIFAGFVLHSNKLAMDEYINEEFYDDFNISVNELKENIIRSVASNLYNSEYEIVLFHLPIKDKKTLIKEIVERAKKELNILNGVK